VCVVLKVAAHLLNNNKRAVQYNNEGH
jgi:hypothetical protein